MDEFRTKRLRWRQPRASDVDAYMAFVSDYEVVKWTATWPHPAEREFVVSRCVPMAPELGFAGPVFAADEMVGGVGIIAGELGLFVAKPHWGNGYATEMARAAIARAFQTQDFDQIVATIWQANAASVRVLDKLGFAQTGTSRHACNAQDKEVDAIDFCLRRADWLTANPLHILTERLMIRPYSASDVTAFHAIAAAQDMARMLTSVPHPISNEQAADWIEDRQYQGRLGFCAGVYLLDGTLIGNVGIGGDPTSIMFFIDPVQWGRGLATEALCGFLDWAFEQFALPELTGGAMADNPASQRVLEKLGFEFARHDTCTSMARLEPAPQLLYRLTRQRFGATR